MRWSLPTLVALGVLLTAPSAPQSGEDPFTPLALTRVASPGSPKDFTTSVSGGGTLGLADYRGRVVFLNFWATWCPPCRYEMPAMERLHRRYWEKGLVIVALSVDADGESSVPPFLKQHGLTFHVGLDSASQVASLYGVRALPSTFLVDRQGRIVARAIGPREWDSPEARALMDRLLAEP